MPPRPVLPVRVAFLCSRQLIPIDLHSCLPGIDDALHVEQGPERRQQVVVAHAVVPQQGLHQGLGKRLPDGLFGHGNRRALCRGAKSSKGARRVPGEPNLYTGPRLGYRRSHPGIVPLRRTAEREDSRRALTGTHPGHDPTPATTTAQTTVITATGSSTTRAPSAQRATTGPNSAARPVPAVPHPARRLLPGAGHDTTGIRHPPALPACSRRLAGQSQLERAAHLKRPRLPIDPAGRRWQESGRLTEWGSSQ